MAKNWWFKFEWNDWLGDERLSRCSLETQGFWLKCICLMNRSDACQLSGSIDELRRMLGCLPEEVTRCAQELKRTDAAEVEFGNGVVVIISRRIRRQKKETEAARKRQAKFRENGGGDPERWTAIRAVVLVRDQKICAYCGKRATTVDHVLPRAQGGLHDESNLVACCKSCNFRKNNRTPEQAGMSFHATFNPEWVRSNCVVTAHSKEIEVKSKKKEKNATTATPKMTDDEWLDSLTENLAYLGLGVRTEYAKARLWADTNNRECTRRFFVNWLNRAKPMKAETNGNGHKHAEVGRTTYVPPEHKCGRCLDMGEVMVDDPDGGYTGAVKFVPCGCEEERAAS